jgi:hypothetical protein
MNRDNDALIRLSNRLDDLARALAALARIPAAVPGEFLCVTCTITTYPTTAAAFYGLQLADAFGTETEGNSVTITPRGGKFLGLNLGTAVPQTGTAITAASDGGTIYFRYDG